MSFMIFTKEIVFEMNINLNLKKKNSTLGRGLKIISFKNLMKI